MKWRTQHAGPCVKDRGGWFRDWEPGESNKCPTRQVLSPPVQGLGSVIFPRGWMPRGSLMKTLRRHTVCSLSFSESLEKPGTGTAGPAGRDMQAAAVRGVSTATQGLCDSATSAIPSPIIPGPFLPLKLQNPTLGSL